MFIFVSQMKLFRKARVSKNKTTIGDVSKHILLVNGLKEKKVLKTSNTGAFYTYPEILRIGPTPDNIAKNLYLYARECNLIAKGQTLYFRDMDEDMVIGQYDVKNGFVKLS